MIEPTRDDIGRRVVYAAEGQERTSGTLADVNAHYAFVRWDVRKRENKQWVAEPSETASPTAFAELEWA